MKIFIDADDRVNYNQIDNNTTVKDLLDGIDAFLDNNPLPCQECEESCCKKSWSVEVDNVCVNRLCNWDSGASLKFVQANLIKKRNYAKDFYQYVLKKDKNCNYINESNRCMIYEKRPIICRLYICSDKSLRYNILREIIGSVYLRALVLEYRINTNNYTQRTLDKYKRNPAVFAHDYDISIMKIVQYSAEQGWLESDEEQLLYEVVS